jgi:hypothetical protein
LAIYTSHFRPRIPAVNPTQDFFFSAILLLQKILWMTQVQILSIEEQGHKHGTNSNAYAWWTNKSKLSLEHEVLTNLDEEFCLFSKIHEMWLSCLQY